MSCLFKGCTKIHQILLLSTALLHKYKALLCCEKEANRLVSFSMKMFCLWGGVVTFSVVTLACLGAAQHFSLETGGM